MSPDNPEQTRFRAVDEGRGLFLYFVSFLDCVDATEARLAADESQKSKSSNSQSDMLAACGYGLEGNVDETHHLETGESRERVCEAFFQQVDSSHSVSVVRFHARLFTHVIDERF